MVLTRAELDARKLTLVTVVFGCMYDGCGASVFIRHRDFVGTEQTPASRLACESLVGAKQSAASLGPSMRYDS